MTAVSTAFFLTACVQQSAPPLAGDWTIDNTASHIAFVSVKSGEIAEAHSFKTVSGQVSETGDANIAIELASVETNIDIRNERMREFLFETNTFPQAKVTAKLTPDSFTSLAVGDSAALTLSAVLSLHGEDNDIEADVIVTRIAADKVQVLSRTPIIVRADDFLLGTGLEKLREIANLPSITPEVPVTFSLVFTQ